LEHLNPLLLFGLIGIALLFDLLNGLHDAANSIATVVSTRVLSPQVAVFWRPSSTSSPFSCSASMSRRRWERASSRPTSSMRR